MTHVRGHLRAAAPADAETIAALATQVFLDTYATEGVRPDIAREALSEYSTAAFADRLRESDRRFVLAENASALVGFAEVVTAARASPAAEIVGAELVRLYVLPRLQRTGIGRQLIHAANAATAALELKLLWLTVWEENYRARAFYRALGFADAGPATYEFGGNFYKNRVLHRAMSQAGAGSPARAVH